MEPWDWVMRWLDLLEPALIVDLLERYFLARWLQCLSSWLFQAVEARNRQVPGAAQRFQEIGAWYTGWKNQIPPELIEYPSIKDTLTKALGMMDRAMRGIPPQVRKRSAAVYFITSYSRSFFVLRSISREICPTFSHGTRI